MRTTVEYTTTEFWEPLLRHRKEVLIEDFELFDQYWVVNERENGLSRLRILRWDQSEDYYLTMEEESYSLYFYYNPEFESTRLRYVFDSLTTPTSVIEYDMLFSKENHLKNPRDIGGILTRVITFQKDYGPMPEMVQNPYFYCLPQRDKIIRIYAYFTVCLWILWSYN